MIDRPGDGRPSSDAPATSPAGLLTNLMRSAVSAVSGSGERPSETGPGSSAVQEREVEGDDAVVPSEGQRGTPPRGLESLSPRLFERRRVARASNPADGFDSGSGPVQEGLEDLQEGYELAFNNLFPDVFLGARASDNPFQGALDGNGGSDAGADTGGDQGGTAGGDESPPSTPEPTAPDPGQEQQPTTPDPAQPGDSGGGGGGDVSQPPDTEQPFSFLVVGRLPGNVSEALVSRARFDSVGDFVLENAYRFSFFPGIFHSILTFEENEKLLMSDMDKDGNLDFLVVSEIPAVGTAIETYLQKSPGEFQLGASTFLYLQAVRSVALFDFNRDGQEELATVLSGSDNLVVYEQVGSEWRYLRELALSIRPALVMSSAVAPGVKSRQLYVVDNDLRFVLTASDRQPDFFRPGSNAPLNRLRVLEANLSGRTLGPTLTLVFNLPDQVVLADGLGGSLRTFGSFQTSPAPPLMIIGDYSRTATRQMLWVP